MNVDLAQHKPAKTYYRGNQECLLCKKREKLVLKTPEELVRQAFVNFLVNEKNVPIQMIDVEIPLSNLAEGAKGRADIVIYGRNEREEYIAVCIVECKREEESLTDDVFDQVVQYDNSIGTSIVIITNLREQEMYTWDESIEGYKRIVELPSYEAMLDRSKLTLDSAELQGWERPSFKNITDKHVIHKFRDNGWIGEDTPQELLPFIVNLASLFYDERFKLRPQVLNGIDVIEDGGVRYTKFGNAAGGKWYGWYRYFIIEDSGGNNQIISIAIRGTEKTRKDPKFGNRRGTTNLIVAVDDYEKSHHSLQLCLDDFVACSGTSNSIWHDGTLTMGRKGRAKNIEVRDHVETRAPELLGPSHPIELGTLDNSKEINWEQKETRYLIGNLIKYALVRDEFRELKR